MPAMQRLYERLRGRGFELLAVSVDKEAADVAAFRDRLAITFPIVLDATEEVARLYQTTGYPETLLIDGQGQVVERYVGPRDWDDPAYISRMEALVREGSAS
jgi:peroxiredoxin